MLTAAGVNHGEFDLLCVLHRVARPEGLTPAELTRSVPVSAAGPPSD